jgi:hypothetical protein
MDDLKTTVPQPETEPRPLTREEAALKHIKGLIKADLKKNPPDRDFDPAVRAYNLIDEARESDPEWAGAQAQVFWGMLTRMYEQNGDRIVRKKFESDPRQGWLALPEYAHVPQVLKVEDGFLPVNEAMPEQFDESLEGAEALLRGWLYVRIKPERLKLQRAKIREMRKARRNAARQYAGAEGMTMGDAMTLHLATLETPKVKRWSKGGKAKNRSNVKSTT